MTPEQSAAVARLREALGGNPEPVSTDLLGDRYFNDDHSTATLTKAQDAFVTACDPTTIRTLLAALDEAQADAAKWRNIGAPIAPEHAEELQRLSDEAVRQFHQDQADAARYRWLRNNPQWLGWDSDFRPDEVEREIDAARAGEKP